MPSALRVQLRQRLKTLRIDLGLRENDPTLKQKYVRKPSSEMEAAG